MKTKRQHVVSILMSWACTAILLSACVPAEVSPTVTLIVLPSLTPSPIPPEVAAVPSAEVPALPQTPALPPAITPAAPTASQPAPPEFTGTALAPGLGPTFSPAPLTHIVQPGETLTSIAAQYGVSVDQIKVYNHIVDSDVIFVGQLIVIPPGGLVVPTAAAPTQGGATDAACTNNASFVADMSLPDNSVVEPGATLVKTWRIRNTGTCTWGSGMSLTFFSGEQMGAPSRVGIPPTAAGGTVDVSITIVTPLLGGSHRGTWAVTAPDSTTFGARPFVLITVLAPGGAISAPSTQAPAQPTLPSPALGQSVSYPNVYNITNTAKQIFATGKARGNLTNVFSKIGDSITNHPNFLYGFGENHYTLGEQAYLQPVVSYYLTGTVRGRNPFNAESRGSNGGWDSDSLLDPTKADGSCGGLTPVECEYTQSKPAVAIIMIGTNDADFHLSSGTYYQKVDQVVKLSIRMGVIPVLSTIPWNKYRAPEGFNRVIISIAQANDIPYIDYWKPMEALPNHGLDSDQVHPSVPPDDQPYNLSNDHLGYGYNVRNLLALQVLDALYRLVFY